MKIKEKMHDNLELAKSIAAEDIHRGDMVAIMDMVYELPSFLWNTEPHVLSPHEPVCIRFRNPGAGKPLKVKAICLPFVLIKAPNGRHYTIDVRRCSLVRLSRDYAKMAWDQEHKALKKKNKVKAK